MNNRIFSFLFTAFCLLACDNEKQNGQATDNTATASIPVTKRVGDIEPGLSSADSLQVLYYDNPDGDSLRYTRYFRLFETADKAQIKSLVKELDQVYTQAPQARPCRSEGKLYLLKGEEILKTVYFSTRGDSCLYFYFIKNGVFVYLPVTATAAAWLKESKRKARKP